MILAIDIGNSDIVLGCFRKEQILFTERMSSELRKTELEYAIGLKTILELYSIPLDALEGAVISSVVPPLTDVIRAAVQKIASAVPVLAVGPGVKTGLSLCMDHPAQVGSNLVVDAVAASAEYGAPVIIIDLGTATTLSVVNREGSYSGGAILPGVRVSLDSLVKGTAQLPNISLTKPRRVIATNTVDSMKCGVIYGNAASIDGMIDRIWQELGYETALVATGDTADAVIPHCRHKIQIDPMLPLKGLQIIFEKNQPRRTEEEVPHAADC